MLLKERSLFSVLVQRREERPRLDAPIVTMLIEPQCPQCQAIDARLLPFNSFLSHVDYFRCPKCGHAWNEPKPGKTRRLKDLTHRDKTPTAV